MNGEDLATTTNERSPLETFVGTRRGRRYTPEFKRRAVEAVLDRRHETGVDDGSIPQVANAIGCSSESLRQWVRRSEVAKATTREPDSIVDRPPARARETPSDSARAAALEEEVRELRSTNEFLKQVSVYFAAQLHAHAADQP